MRRAAAPACVFGEITLVHVLWEYDRSANASCSLGLGAKSHICGVCACCGRLPDLICRRRSCTTASTRPRSRRRIVRMRTLRLRSPRGGGGISSRQLHFEGAAAAWMPGPARARGPAPLSFHVAMVVTFGVRAKETERIPQMLSRCRHGAQEPGARQGLPGALPQRAGAAERRRDVHPREGTRRPCKFGRTPPAFEILCLAPLSWRLGGRCMAKLHSR